MTKAIWLNNANGVRVITNGTDDGCGDCDGGGGHSIGGTESSIHMHCIPKTQHRQCHWMDRHSIRKGKNNRIVATRIYQIQMKIENEKFQSIKNGLGRVKSKKNDSNSHENQSIYSAYVGARYAGWCRACINMHVSCDRYRRPWHINFH